MPIIEILTLTGIFITMVIQIVQLIQNGTFESECGCCSLKHDDGQNKNINVHIDLSNDLSTD